MFKYMLHMCLMSCHANISFIKLIFFSLSSHFHMFICVDWMLEQTEKNVISKYSFKNSNLYVLMWAETDHMFVLLLRMPNQNEWKKNETKRKECAPKNCSYCEICCFYKIWAKQKNYVWISIGATHHTHQKII